MSVRCIENRIKQQSGDPHWTRRQIRRHNRARKYGRRHTPPRFWWTLEVRDAELCCRDCGASFHATEDCNVSTCAKCGRRGFNCICYELEYEERTFGLHNAMWNPPVPDDDVDLYWLIYDEEPASNPGRFDRFSRSYWYGTRKNSVA